MMDRKLDELSAEVSKDEKMDSKGKTAFDLNLIQQERKGDILFLIGTLLAFAAADQDEAAVLQTQEEIKQSLGDAALRTLTIESWIFFAASIIFANTAVLRLKKLEAEREKQESISDTEILCGSKIATFGSLIKAIGFAVTAVGHQISYNNTQNKPFTG